MKENPYADMDKGAYRIAHLVAGYIRGTITEKEHDELDNWVNASDHNMRLFEELTDENNLEANLAWMDKVKTEQSFNELKDSGAFENPNRKFKVRRVWVAAASVILIVGAFLVYRLSTTTKNNSSLLASDTTTLKPGGNRAILTIDGGATIDLTTTKNGIIQQSEGSHVSKPVDGELVYETDTSTDGTFKIHTLSTPVGGQFQVTLSDGTKVWLNAATTLKYPSRFSTSERRVEVAGEAYFEVAKDTHKPFHVSFNNVDLEVLGTHFNINSYTDEPTINTTLLEGSVKIYLGGSTQVLKSGEQSQIQNNGIRIINVDTTEAIAWKNHVFKFKDAPIEAIMRQVTRWYDAEVVFKDKVSYHFNATVDRTEPISKLLHYLEETGQIHFITENKTITVMK